MCQSIAEGGRRCSGTPTGKALYALYRERRANPSEEVNARIANVKEAEKLYGGRFVTPFEMALPDGVSEAMDVARYVGNPLIVGGAVRDVKAGAASKDTDIEVYGVSLDKLTKEFRSAGFHVDEVGKAFGVLKVSKRGVVSDLDVAVPRTENAVGAGHRGFEVNTDQNMTVTDAAARRDFTINAMSYDPRLGVLIDPYNGARDLEDKKLRAVSEKFAEDPLRVLRGVQFAARFGMELDAETAALCRKLRPKYSELATERVQEEWVKLWTKGTRPDLAMKALKDSGWADTVDGLESALTEDTSRRLMKLTSVPLADRAATGAAVVAHAMDESKRRAFVKTTTVGNDAVRLSMSLVDTDPSALISSYDRKTYMNDVASKGFTFEKYRRYAQLIGDRAGVRAANKAIAEGIGSSPEPALIQGRDIIPLTSAKPGPWLGKLVAQALDAQYHGEFADKSGGLDWIRAHLAV